MAKKIVILGAGVTGLSCAYHLKREYNIYEKENEAGGLCRSHEKNGFTFDFTGHLLHFKTSYGFNLVKSLLRGNLVPHKRNSWIYSNNTYTPYPFQANIHSLSRNAAKECLIGLVCSKRKQVSPRNFYDWMIQKFGYGIVKHFMLPYNYKFWKQHPKNLSCEWLDGMIPLPSLEDSISGAFEQGVKHWGYNWRFWYPSNGGGISVLPRAFEKKIRAINFNHKVRRIDLKRKMVIFDNSSSTKFDYIVSTIPLPELEKIIYPIPQRVRSAMKKLKYLSIYNLNIGISRNHLKKHWIYFPDKKDIFYRLGFFSNFSKELAPRGSTSIYAEVSYSKNKPLKKKKDLDDKIKRDLLRSNIVTSKNEIRSSLANDIKYGYIIYDQNYSNARKTILEFLRKAKIFSRGRFGNWRYFSMEDSILDGKSVAEGLN
ncbi:protoporphyrinogen/coproporphyrinogen oxidase [Candidatus Omnitrophota bacterium]